jgi:hypothetical protein
MLFDEIIRRVQAYGKSTIHAARLKALLAAVMALVRCQNLSLSELGRAIAPQKDKPKHGIKRMERLLGNPHLHRERSELFAVIAQTLLKPDRSAVILIDWTEVGQSFVCLVAAVPFLGRALPIYAEAHPLSKLGNAQVERNFLGRLSELLPRGCKPILVADAGFRGPFCQAVRALGWDFIIRLRSRCNVHLDGQQVCSHKSLFAQATARPRRLGQGEFAPEGATTRASFVLVKKAAKRKRSCAKSNRAKKPRSRSEQKARVAAREPWLLATSLSLASARVICDLYATRMQIEETFRDTKNPRYGWSLEHTNYQSTQRLDVLFLLIALAMARVTLLGVAAELAHRHLAYQSNSIKTRRVLSFFVLGNMLIKRNDLDWLDESALEQALAYCQDQHERRLAGLVT